MKRLLLLICSFSLISLSACVTVKPGADDAAAFARKLIPAKDKTTIYFCRESAFAGGGIALYPAINGVNVAKLAKRTFTRIELPPGEYEVALAYSDSTDSAFHRSMTRRPVKMEVIQGKAGEVREYWIGVAGSSFFGGSLTIDYFDSKAQLRACLNDAIYVDPIPSEVTK